MLRQFYDDEAGAVISAELVVIATVLVLGLIVGWVVLRNAVFRQLHNQAHWIAGEDPDHDLKPLQLQKIQTAADVFAEGKQ